MKQGQQYALWPQKKIQISPELNSEHLKKKNKYFWTKMEYKRLHAAFVSIDGLK